MARKGRSPPFTTVAQVSRYLGGKIITCLLCGRRLQRLGSHLESKHGMSADDYRVQFGIPWTRSLTSAPSRAKSRWGRTRKVAARRIALATRFFSLAHSAPRRESPVAIKRQYAANLGARSIGFGPKFDRQVRIWFDKGRSDQAIADKLGVSRSAVRKRTIKWKRSRHRRRYEQRHGDAHGA
jgi:hypothetical protein